jgi:hypothetical protein
VRHTARSGVCELREGRANGWRRPWSARTERPRQGRGLSLCPRHPFLFGERGPSAGGPTGDLRPLAVAHYAHPRGARPRVGTLVFWLGSLFASRQRPSPSQSGTQRYAYAARSGSPSAPERRDSGGAPSYFSTRQAPAAEAAAGPVCGGNRCTSPMHTRAVHRLDRFSCDGLLARALKAAPRVPARREQLHRPHRRCDA